MNRDKEGTTAGMAVRSFLFPFSLVLLLPLGCCQTCEHVEAELRSREAENLHLRDELHRAAAANKALTQQLQALHPSQSAKVPGDGSPYCVVSQIVLGRGTGGFDADHQPGDDALQVVLEPRDPTGHVIKAAGSVQIEVLEVGSGDQKTSLSTWDISPEELMCAWRPGLWSSGYFLILPWKTWPSTNRLHLVVQLTVGDGHAFKAEKTFTIRPTPAAHRKPAADTPTPLPAPRKLESKPEAHGKAPDPVWPKEGVVETTTNWMGTPQPPLNEAVRLQRPEPLDNPLLERRFR
jgi:hypothetical protein